MSHIAAASPPEANTGNYLRVSEAAAEMNVSPRFIYDLISARKIDYSKFGQGRQGFRVHRDSLEAYMRSRVVPARAKG